MFLYFCSSLSISDYVLLQIAAPFVLGVGELPGNEKFAVWARKPSHNTSDAIGGTNKFVTTSLILLSSMHLAAKTSL